MAAINAHALAVAEAAVSRKPNWERPRGNAWSTVQMFFNVNMAKQHDGLKKLAENYDIDMSRLEPGQFVAFLNRKRTRLKMFTAGNIFLYLSLEEGQVTPELISQIPSMFKGENKVEFEPVFIEALESEIPKFNWEIESENRRLRLASGRRS